MCMSLQFSTFLYNSLHLSTSTSRILQNCLQFSGFPSAHPPTMPQIPPHFHYNSVNSSTIFDIYMSLYNFYNSLHGSTILYIFLEHFSTMLYNFVEFSSPLFFCIVSELYTHLATSLYNSRYVSLHCPTCLDNSLHVSTFVTFLWISLHFFAIIYTSLHAQISSILYMSPQFSNSLLSCLYISPQSFTILYMSHVSCMSRQFSTCLYNSGHFLKFLVQLQRSVCPQSAAVGSNGSTVNQQTVYTTVSLKYGCSRSGISLQISTNLYNS